MTTYSFDTVVGTVISSFNKDSDDLNIAYGADVTSLTQSGSDLVVTVSGIGSVTLTGITLGMLVGSGTNQNISVASGELEIGDNTTDDALDALAQTINGTTGADIIYGMGGADTITGANGNDVIYGGTGATDTTDGADQINTGTDSALVYGNAGNDDINVGIIASGATQTIYGGLGDEDLDVGALVGNAVIYGNTGADDLNVSNATITSSVSIFGGNSSADTTDGADTITLGAGDATVYSNSGADTIEFFGDTGKTQTIFAGIDNDTITDVAGAVADGSYAIAAGWGADTVTINSLGSAPALTVYGGNGLTDTGDSGIDTITVTGTATLLSAKLYGNAGNDVITYTAVGDAGTAATINGGVGDDTLSVTLTNTDTAAIEVGSGNDTVTLITAAADGTFTVTGYDSSDTLTLNLNDSAAADMTVATGSSSTVIDDTGNEGAVILNGYTGNLSLTMNDGTMLKTNTTSTAITMTGSDDATDGDLLISGSAGDTFQFDDAVSDLTAADVVTGGTGTDVITFANATTIADADLTLVTDVETLLLADGANTVTIDTEFLGSGITTIDGSASSGILTLSDSGVVTANLTVNDGAGAANIDLEQATGNNTFSLGAGVDNIVAGDGADTIDGGTGDDVIQGEAGADSLTGGTGTDTFTFEATAVLNGVDVITDFSTSDALDVSGFAGDNDLTATVADSSTGGAAFADDDIYLITDADGSIDTAAEVAALFTDGAGNVLDVNGFANGDGVLLIRGTADTTVWYIDNDATDAIVAGEAVQVATLTSYTGAFADANITD